MRSLSTTLFLAIATLTSAVCFGQGTLQITFDGPPVIPSGSGVHIQSYVESGMWFQPIPGTDGFVRQGGGISFYPDDGSDYVQRTLGDSLMFGFSDNSLFSISSIDLAGYSTGVPNVMAQFVGYRADGSTVTASVPTSGITFQTYDFGSEWSDLTRVEIPDFGSLDNLVVSVPEPSASALFIVGAFILQLRKRKLAGGTPALPRSNRDVGENFYVGTQL